MRALRRRARGAAIISFSLGVEFGRCVVGMLSRRRTASFVYGRKVRLYCNVYITLVIDGPSVRLSTMLPFLGRVWDEDGLLGTDKDALWQAIHVNRLLCYIDGPDKSTGCVGNVGKIPERRFLLQEPVINLSGQKCDLAGPITAFLAPVSGNPNGRW